jgi:ribosomal-protein-alanine N-acetyltransferase
MSQRLILRPPHLSDYRQWAELRTKSEEFLKPWEPTWSDREMTRLGFRNRVKYYRKGLKDGNSYAFFLFSRTDETLLGGLTLSNIRHGVIGSCSLGYWIGEPYARRGYMYDAIQTALPFVFHTLALHRLEAACLAENVASIKLLEKCGFKREGLARDYLRINGAWRDHLLFSLLEGEY